MNKSVVAYTSLIVIIIFILGLTIYSSTLDTLDISPISSDNDLKKMPKCPSAGLYDTSGKTQNSINNYPTFKNNMINTCTNIMTDACPMSQEAPTDKTDANYNFKKNAYNGVVNNKCDMPYYYTLTGELPNKLATLGYNKDVRTQINYLTCQLANCRNAVFNYANMKISDVLKINMNLFKNQWTVVKDNWLMRTIYIIIFMITLYLLVVGSFSSIIYIYQLYRNVIKDTFKDLNTWLFIFGILVSVALFVYTPFLIKDLSNKLTSKEIITNDPYGQKTDKGAYKKSGDIITANDYLILTIYVVIISLLLFSFYYINNSMSNSILSSGYLVTSIFALLILSLFWLIYSSQKMYSKYPEFYKTDNNSTCNSVTTNIVNEGGTNITLKYVVFILILYTAFCIVYSHYSSNNKSSSLASMLFGLTFIGIMLIIPFIILLNWIFGIQFFLAYPMFILIMRFFRYLCYYMIQVNVDDIPQDEAQRYTASWDLIGLDIIKFSLKGCGLFDVINEQKQQFGDNLIKNKNKF